MTLSKYLRVGVIQTVVDRERAWKGSHAPSPLCMSTVEELRAIKQIRTGLGTVLRTGADIVVLPELAIPKSEISTLSKIAAARDVLIVGGIDYQNMGGSKRSHVVENNAMLFVPKNWGTKLKSSWSVNYSIPKMYPAPVEIQLLKKSGYKISGKNLLYIFSTVKYGNIGVCICYDLMDLQRALIYRKNIDHLIVVAYNQDIDSFSHLAEAFSRTIYCNVIICNTGYYGGSVAISPYYRREHRVRFGHMGMRLYAYQVFDIPCMDFITKKKTGLDPGGLDKDKQRFKALPPGI